MAVVWTYIRFLEHMNRMEEAMLDNIHLSHGERNTGEP
jgi:hypothetical protein